MYKVKDFIPWALSHAKGHTQPWHYLFGSVRVQTTKATLDRYYENHYATQMTRARFDELTADWLPTDYATDCQGLCDAYLTYECGEQTDINADMTYRLWCTDKGKIDDINRGYVIGEAVFMCNSAGKMKHIGWVCGFDGSEPLIVEAKGIAYGVVVTRFYDGNWTHRGLMTKKFDYTEENMIDFNQTSPMQQGMTFAKMQDVLNDCGYTDYEGKPLEADGKWGKRSKSAFAKLIADYAEQPEPAPAPEPADVLCEGNKFRLVLEYK